MYHTIEYTRRKERSWFSGTFLECEREKKKLEEEEFNTLKPRTPEQEVDGRRKYLNWYINHIASGEGFKIDFLDIAWNFTTRNGFINPVNQNKKYCRKYAEMMLKRIKNPFEIDLTPIDEWEQLMRYKLFTVFLRYLRVKFTNDGLIKKMHEITDEQIMK